MKMCPKEEEEEVKKEAREMEKMEMICENTVATGDVSQSTNFIPTIRSGEWSDIGSRDYMEDTHVCITDLAKSVGYDTLDREVVSFYGVFDGHGGEGAAHFVRDNLPRVIVEDSDFPLKLGKVVTRSFLQTDTQFARTCALQSTLSSGTTALTAMIHGRSLLIANAGDCRAVLSRVGIAIELSTDHRPCCTRERKRIESLGGFVDDGYLNGQLGVTRAIGNWHLEGLKDAGQLGGPLIAEPELKSITLSKEDEFLIIASDGLWDVFSSQNAVDFARRKLREHNDVRRCCKELIEEAIRLDASDNLTVVMVCFHSDPPPVIAAQRGILRRTLSADVLHSIKCLVEEKKLKESN